MTLYDRIAQSERGRRGLSSARLRYSVVKALHSALENSGITQSELASRLGVRKSAVNAVFRGNGNLRVNTIAEYLDALDMEAEIRISPAGTARQAHVESNAVTIEVPATHQNQFAPIDLEWLSGAFQFLSPPMSLQSRTCVRDEFARAS